MYNGLIKVFDFFLGYFLQIEGNSLIFDQQVNIWFWELKKSNLEERSELAVIIFFNQSIKKYIFPMLRFSEGKYWYEFLILKAILWDFLKK